MQGTHTSEEENLNNKGEIKKKMAEFAYSVKNEVVRIGIVATEALEDNSSDEGFIPNNKNTEKKNEHQHNNIK